MRYRQARTSIYKIYHFLAHFVVSQYFSYIRSLLWTYWLKQGTFIQHISYTMAIQNALQAVWKYSKSRCFSIFSLFFFSPLSCRRFVLNDTLFSELVDVSRDLPGNRWAVGGNAPVMAGRMATEGCDVLLGGSFSPDFTDVLSQHITGI